MAVELKVPSAGESIVEVEVGTWLKKEGDRVEVDEPVVEIETDKATMELPSPVAGTLTRIHQKQGARVSVGDVLGEVEAGDGKQQAKSRIKKPASNTETKQDAPEPVVAKTAESRSESEPKAGSDPGTRVMPAAKRVLAEKSVDSASVTGTGPGGRIVKADAERATARRSEPSATKATMPGNAETRGEEVVPMSLLRRKIAERLVSAQHNAALLTTFNEIDMSAVIALRKTLGEAFLERYGVKLGFLSFFVKAVVDSLKQTPELNAEVREDSIAYRHYYDIGIAVGGGKGLVVPAIRSAEHLSFAEVETAIRDFADRAKAGKLSVEELQGGTFTITNGGIYGSLLSTPIVNPPQSGILGLHAIQERPIAVAGQVVVRPMMYVAVTYDHRIVDGREAVGFLVRVKQAVENPSRLLLEV